MNSPLAIVGASARSAAASAIRAGFQPLTADLFADADLRRIATATRIRPYPDGFLDWLRAIEPPAWMYTGALENHPELVDQMAWIAPLVGNPGDVLTQVRSPWELASALRSAGLLFPEIRSSDEGLPRDGTWLAKTYRGASGSGVRALEIPFPFREGPLEIPLPFREGPGDGSNHVFQQRVAGTPCAAVYVADGIAATLLGITRQLIGAPWLGGHGFQYAGSIGPWPVSESTRATVARVGNILAERFELLGLFGVDFILDAEQVWTLEVNPRYTASVEIVERCTGASPIAAHVAACNGLLSVDQQAGSSSTPVGPAGDGSRSHGKAILFAKRDVLITQAFADYTLAEALRTPWPTLADVSPAGTPIESGRPILTVFAYGSTVEEVDERLRERVVDLESKLYALTNV